MKSLETPSKIELDELMEENVELEEKLNGGGGNALNSADISNAYDSTCSQQDNLSNKIINNGHSDVNETVFAPQ